MTAGSLHPPRLPWFAAGTLEPAEAAEVERHLQGCAECRDDVDALRSMTRTLRAVGPRGHVPADRLVTYHGGGGEISTEERARIADHVEGCPTCRADLHALERADASLRARGRRRVLGVAASLLLVTLAGWQLASWRSPAPGTPILARVALTPALRGGVPTLPAGPCELKVLLPAHAHDPVYGARVQLPSGKFRVLGTVESKDQWVTLRVRDGFAPGFHVLFLTAGSEVHAYGFDVQAPP